MKSLKVGKTCAEKFEVLCVQIFLISGSLEMDLLLYGATVHPAFRVHKPQKTPPHLDAYDTRFGDLLFLDRRSRRALRHLVESGYQQEPVVRPFLF